MRAPIHCDNKPLLAVGIRVYVSVSMVCWYARWECVHRRWSIEGLFKDLGAGLYSAVAILGSLKAMVR